MAETAAAELHRMIMSGELPAGTHLRLADLTAALDMSAMPVREGLRRLEALGLVEIIPHKGAWVRDVSLDDLLDTHQTRLALETLAIRSAAERFTAQDAEAARHALHEHAKLAGADDPIPARQAHTAFHFTLYRAGGSRWLPRAIEPVWENSERYRFATRPTPDGLAHIQAEHQAILDACVAGDPEAAVTALTRHLENAMRRIQESMPARLAGVAEPA
ncbi:GntR family transcriptional regulator [Micromonospora fluostatini]|uniref:GntR family transcriptional regulator n=1 Tax=Micromonospora sp. JCM 30529 TaxID=3421643 RepID=UPI003D1630A6